MKCFAWCLVPALLAGCATAPRPLQGEYASVVPAQASARSEGVRVRWGGSIVGVETRAAETCFEVLGRSLDVQARPRTVDASQGRFLACRSGFYDPAVFAKGRDITVTGTLRGHETRNVGKYPYDYPRVESDAVYLWPKRSDIIVDYRPGPIFYSSPFGFGYSRPVLIHRPRLHRHR